MILRPAAYSRLCKLHALSGVFPLGAFLVWHLAVNFTAVFGAGVYDRTSSALQRLPLVVAAEVLLIGAPIALHVAIGALIANTDRALRRERPHRGPRLTAAQRASGAILLAYVFYHVWSVRLTPEVRHAPGGLHAAMGHHLADPGVLPFYALGVIAACVHFGVGVYDVANRFRILGAPAAPALAGRVAIGASGALAAIGLVTLAGFR